MKDEAKHVRVQPSGWKYELAYFRGWLAWLFVVKLWPARWLMSLPGDVLAWAGFYAYDDRHLPNAREGNGR